MIEQFGGEKLAVRLDQVVRDTARTRDWSVRIEHGLIHNMRTDLRWQDYSAVMAEALSFAITVAGYRLVEGKVKNLTAALEDKTGKSYFEIAFRLGLHRMQRKIA